MVLVDQRRAAECGVCLENYSDERRGFKCGTCQFPACEHCWKKASDTCPQCRKEACRPYFDRILTLTTATCTVYCQNAEFDCVWRGTYGEAASHLKNNCQACSADQLSVLLEEAEEKIADLTTSCQSYEAQGKVWEAENIYLQDLLATVRRERASEHSEDLDRFEKKTGDIASRLEAHLTLLERKLTGYEEALQGKEEAIADILSKMKSAVESSTRRQRAVKGIHHRESKRRRCSSDPGSSSRYST